jgi:hypothetical protein
MLATGQFGIKSELQRQLVPNFMKIRLAILSCYMQRDGDSKVTICLFTAFISDASGQRIVRTFVALSRV